MASVMPDAEVVAAIADEVRRHDPSEGWRRESYCSCGASTEPYGAQYIDHLAAAITGRLDRG
jgi:hypothetical protein